MVQDLNSVDISPVALPFYHANLSADSTRRLLSREPEGTFLLRPSSARDALATISVRGPTSVTNMRLYHSQPPEGAGVVFVDCPLASRHYFASIGDLLNFYTSVRAIYPLDSSGKAIGAKFRLSRPLLPTQSSLIPRRHALDAIL